MRGDTHVRFGGRARETDPGQPGHRARVRPNSSRREHPGRDRPRRVAAVGLPGRPGREHDTTCARTHPGLHDTLTDWTDGEHAVLADLGYEGENTRLVCPVKNIRGVPLTVEQRTINALHSATHALAERGNSLLKTTFKGLRRVTLCPWRIGAITAAALVLLHHEHDRTT